MALDALQFRFSAVLSKSEQTVASAIILLLWFQASAASQIARPYLNSAAGFVLTSTTRRATDFATHMSWDARFISTVNVSTAQRDSY